VFRPALLILVPALALPVLSYRTIMGDSTANAALATASAPPLPEAPVLDMRDEASYALVIERPLFTQSRRPAQVAPQAVAAESSVGLTLLGVVMKATRSLALIRAGEGTPAVKAEVGQEVAGWQLTMVAPTQVILNRHGGEMSLELPFKAAVPVAAAAPAPVPAPQPEAVPQPEPAAEDVPQS
jgi:hypothetical protein